MSMDQYVDMYLRKKRAMVAGAGLGHAINSTHGSGGGGGFYDAANTAPQTNFGIGAAPAASHQSSSGINQAAHLHHGMSVGVGGVDSHLEALVLRSAAGVQQFAERADALTSQVETFEDKLTNLAKLVKISQAIHDEKEAQLLKQNQELKARLKRQEQVTYRLEKEVEEIKALVGGRGASGQSISEQFESTESRISVIDRALADFISTYKDECRQSHEQQTDLARGMKELAEAHESNRVNITNDLNNVKEWAARNLTRLKKHVDLTSSDLTALKDSHVETAAQLQRVKVQTDNEHEKLMALLHQKSREANLLTEIVDKEIQSIHAMTKQHRAGLGNTLTNGNTAQQHVLVGGGGSSARGSPVTSSLKRREGESKSHRSDGDDSDMEEYAYETVTDRQANERRRAVGTADHQPLKGKSAVVATTTTTITTNSRDKRRNLFDELAFKR